MADKKEVMQHKEGDGLIRVFRAFAVLALVAGVAFFVYSNTFSSDAGHPFKLGLDLAGGSQLVYQADVTDVNASDVPALMNVVLTFSAYRNLTFRLSGVALFQVVSQLNVSWLSCRV